MPKNHAFLGPSKLEAVEQCPCYDREPFEQRDDTGETPSERGTRLHEAAEKRDLTLCHNDQERGLIELVLQSEDIMVQSAGAGAQVLREERVEIPDPDDPEEVLTWGTADWLMVYPDGLRARGRDLKFIRTPSVSAPQQNLQIRAYAVAVLCKYPQLQQVEFDLLMPEFNHLPDPVVLTRDDILPTQRRIKGILETRMDPFKQPCPGDVCATCKHASRCPALGKLAVQSARGMGLPIPESFAIDQPRTPYECSLALIIAQALAQWAEQVKAFMNERGRADPGTEIPGFKWMQRKGNPKVLDVGRAKTLLPLSEPDFLSCCGVSLTKLADKVREVHGVSAKEARATVDNALREIIVRGADVAFWQRAKDGEQLAEIVAGAQRKELPSSTPTA